MRRNLLAVGAAALLAGSASAATFSMHLSGTIDTGIPGVCGLGFGCDYQSPWLGTLTVETDSTADGTYFDADLPMVSFTSSLYSFTRTSADVDTTNSNAFVTLANGIPVSMNIEYDTSAYETFSVTGMLASYVLYDGYGGGPIGLSTVGAARVFEVPEPSAGWLMLAGLGLAAGLRFRGGSARSGRPASTA